MNLDTIAHKLGYFSNIIQKHKHNIYARLHNLDYSIQSIMFIKKLVGDVNCFSKNNIFYCIQSKTNTKKRSFPKYFLNWKQYLPMFTRAVHKSLQYLPISFPLV